MTAPDDIDEKARALARDAVLEYVSDGRQRKTEAAIAAALRAERADRDEWEVKAKERAKFAIVTATAKADVQDALARLVAALPRCDFFDYNADTIQGRPCPRPATRVVERAHGEPERLRCDECQPDWKAIEDLPWAPALREAVGKGGKGGKGDSDG